jgi:hypothetical protein
MLLLAHWEPDAARVVWVRARLRVATRAKSMSSSVCMDVMKGKRERNQMVKGMLRKRRRPRFPREQLMWCTFLYYNFTLQSGSR